MSKMTNSKLVLLALAGLGAVASGPAFADSMTVDSRGGLEVFQTSSKDYWFRFGGRMMFDQAWFDVGDNGSGFPSGSQIRNARMSLKGGVGAHWVYKLDLDFIDAADVSGRSRFGEAWLGYDACEAFFFAVGQISVPFGLENWGSSSDTPLMELSLPSNAFAPDYGLGLYAEWHGQVITLAGAIYHPGAGTRQTGDVIASPAVVGGVVQNGDGPFGSDPGSDTLGGAARFTFSPVHDNYTVYHLGLSGRYEDRHNEANGFDYFTGMEVRARQTPFLFTNIPPNSVKDAQVYGLELAGRWGPMILQGEYMWARANREDVYPVGDLRNPGGDQKYHGYYVEASYVLTGETKEYDFNSGTFGAVHPRCKSGAWEIVARHSYVNLLDNQDFADPNSYFFFVDFPTDNFTNFVDVNDIVGAVHATTVGLTWWVNDNVRFLANYNRTSLPQDFSVSILGLRAQVIW